MTKQVSAEAAALAREIFKLGDEPNSPCKRIQFKGGKWPHNERNQGGICEVALAEFIDKSRATLPSAGDGKDTERLDWLEKRDRACFEIRYQPRIGAMVENQVVIHKNGTGNIAVAPNFRTAIDAARGEPSPPPPQPAGEGEAKVIVDDINACLVSLDELLTLTTGRVHYKIKPIKTLLQSSLKTLASSQARIEELERELKHRKFNEEFLDKMGIKTLAAKYLDPKCWKGCQSLVWQHREAELTAAIMDSIETLAPILVHASTKFNRELCYISNTLKLALKPASALTAAKEPEPNCIVRNKDGQGVRLEHRHPVDLQ